MSRQERIRRERKVSYSQEEIERASKELAEAEEARLNATNEEFEAFKAAEQATFQASIDRQHEERLARQWEIKCLSPEERGQTPDLYDIRNHPGPPQRLIDFLDFDQ